MPTIEFHVTKDRVYASILTVLGCMILCLSSCSKKEILRPDPNRLIVTTLHTGMNEPMELDILPDGEVLFIERPGKIKKYEPLEDTVKTVGILDVRYENENGLLGLTLDPDFVNNHWIYLFYTAPGEVSKQHVSRFDLTADSVILSSEKVLLEIPIDGDICCHSGGCLEFGPDGNLYISTGDNSNPTEFGPIDERPGRWHTDSQRTSANTLDLRGKILRIRPQPDGTYTIPEGNLFDQKESSTRPEIYIMGNRNPFRMSIDALTGILYWGDMGPNPSGEQDSLRGPRSHEEINRAEQAGNYGWPYLLADNKPYRDFDYHNHEMGDLFDPESLVNDSPSNTGLRKLPKASGAFIWYPNTPSDLFPEVGTGGGSAMAGPVYHYDQYSGSEVALPEYFDSKLFIFDWMRNWIIAASINEAGDLAGLEPFVPAGVFASPIDMQIGPHGGLYVLDYGTHWYVGNSDAKLALITYARESLPLVANQESSSTARDENASGGPAPDLSIHFESNRSFYYPDETYNYVVKVKELASGTSDLRNDSSAIKVRLHYFPDNKNTNNSDVLDNLNNPFLKFSSGRTLIEQSDCKACHVDKSFSMGPAFAKISERYKDRQDLIGHLSQKILTGGGGVWGEFNMPPHPQHNVDEARQMIQYILSIQKFPKQERWPLTGAFKTADEINQGVYVLSASYSDPGTGVLISIESLILRHPLVPANAYDSASGVSISTNVNLEGLVEIEKNGAFISFNDIDLQGINNLFFRFRSSANRLQIETRLDSTEGQLIGVIDTRLSVEDHEMVRVSEMAIDKIGGQHDLYFVIESDEKEPNDDGIAQLESIYFSSKGRVVSF
jgi:cytochrome c